MTDVTKGQLSARDQHLTKRGLRLAQFTVGYNVIEGAVAIAAGILAGLVSLVGFGFDSGIESIAAVLVGLRLAARLRSGEADEDRERRVDLGVGCVDRARVDGHLVRAVAAHEEEAREGEPETHASRVAAGLRRAPRVALCSVRVWTRLGGAADHRGRDHAPRGSRGREAPARVGQGARPDAA